MKGTAARFYVNLFAAILAVSWLVALSTGCSGEVAAAAAPSSTQTAGPTTLELAVGSFTGEYRFSEPARGDVYRITLVIDAYGSVTAAAETREGATVELTGTLEADGSMNAHGRPPQAEGEATLTGTLIVKGGAVSIEGSWQSASGDTGTWIVTKDEL